MQWEEDGYLVFENAIVGDELQRLQSAFDYSAERSKSAWLERIEAGLVAATFYDIPDVLEKDDIFIDIVDHPSYYGRLMAFTDDDLIFLTQVARVVPSCPAGYSGWHSDVGRHKPLHIKVQVYVNDVEPDCGEFGYVPKSHKADAGLYNRPNYLKSMPGYKTFPGGAGTAIIFNTYGLHTAMDNHSGIARKSMILTYEKRAPDRVDAQTFAPISDHCTTPERRRLFSLQQ